MSIAERYKYIQEQLNKHGYIRVADIANELNVTKATIRKDLRFLESQKVLYRTHGSATAANPHVMDISVQVKSHINTELKRIIAREAAKLIADNDSIIVASGSTLYAFAEQIATDSHLNVVTPDLRVAVLLNENEKIDVIQLGGKIYKNTLSVRGEMAATELKDIRCSKVFFGSDGIDDETGITCSTLEEARADLFGLYYLGDEKLVELGLIPSLDVAWAQYADYIMNGMMTQLSRIEPGKNVEESHMRNRKLIAEWCYEKGRADKVIEWVVDNGKRYIVVNDFRRLRELFGELLREVQRIKSEGDYEAGKQLVERYAVAVDAEVLRRYRALNIEPYGGFVNPEYRLVYDPTGTKVVDVEISYPADYVQQMLGYGREYSLLPNLN